MEDLKVDIKDICQTLPKGPAIAQLYEMLELNISHFHKKTYTVEIANDLHKSQDWYLRVMQLQSPVQLQSA